MKTLCSLLVAVIVSLLGDSCAKGQTNEPILIDVGGRTTLISSNFPPNCLVVKNRTTNVLDVLFGGEPVKMRVRYHERILTLDSEVEPLETLAFEHCFEMVHMTNQAKITIRAKGYAMAGDVLFEREVGRHEYALHGLGTDSAPIMVEVEQKDLK